MGTILPHLQNGAAELDGLEWRSSSSVNLGRERVRAGPGTEGGPQCPAPGRYTWYCPAEASSWPLIWAWEHEAFFCHLPQTPSDLTTATEVLSRSPGPQADTGQRAALFLSVSVFTQTTGELYCKVETAPQCFPDLKTDRVLSSTMQLKGQDPFYQRRSNDIVQTKRETRFCLPQESPLSLEGTVLMKPLGGLKTTGQQIQPAPTLVLFRSVTLGSQLSSCASVSKLKNSEKKTVLILH